MEEKTRVGGRQAMSDTEKQERGRRLRELRLALGFKTHQALADASPDESLERTYVVRAEKGQNAVSTLDMQRRFAAAMGVDVIDLANYLDGALDRAEVLARRGRASSAPDESSRVHPVIASVAHSAKYTEHEAELASTSIRGLAGSASMTEEQALEFLSKARITLRDNARALAAPAGTVVQDVGGSALDELGGGKGSIPARARRR